MTGPSFRDAESEGWDRKAGYWDDNIGLVTLGAIDPLMEAVAVGPGVRVLDIAVALARLPPRQLGVVLMLSEWISPRP